LALTGAGALHESSALTVKAGATFDTSAQAGHVFSSAAGTTVGVGATSAGLIKAASATFSSAALEFDFGSVQPLSETYQVFDISGAKTGHFGSVTATGTTINGAFLHDGSGTWTLASAGFNLTFVESSGLLSVNGVIPEPATFTVLAGLAVAGFAATRRRRRA